eukprot:3938224-Rhodomonas_salina.1
MHVREIRTANWIPADIPPRCRFLTAYGSIGKEIGRVHTASVTTGQPLVGGERHAEGDKRIAEERERQAAQGRGALR